MGISGAAIGVILSIAGMLIIWYPLSQKITKASRKIYFSTLWPPAFCSLFMAGGLYVAKIFWEPVGQSLVAGISIFSIIVIASIGIYLAAMYLLHKYYPKYDIFGEVKFFYKSLVRK
jgi:hypothetical protein